MASVSNSPTLSRTPSSLFSPAAPHRRSHPNLQHLSLAPLTPKYPISAADYDAYYDPITSDLHTSTSLSHIAALPSPGGILSKPNSRSASRTRRKNKSVQIRSDAAYAAAAAAHAAPSGALTSEGFGSHVTTSATSGIKPSRSRLRLHTTVDEGWLTQTALSLTEGTRESKGQLWIAKRDSSTSLHSPSPDGGSHVNLRAPVRASGFNTPGSRSRRGSRARLSKRSLAMTPAVGSAGEEVRPQWVVDEEGAGGEDLDEEDEEEDEFFRDRYGMVDFTDQFDSDDEREVRSALQKRGFIMGRWIDGVIDSLVMLEPEPELEDVPEESTVGFASANVSVAGDSIEEPLEQPKSVWDDVRWFGRVVGKTLGS